MNNLPFQVLYTLNGDGEDSKKIVAIVCHDFYAFSQIQMGVALKHVRHLCTLILREIRLCASLEITGTLNDYEVVERLAQIRWEEPEEGGESQNPDLIDMESHLAQFMQVGFSIKQEKWVVFQVRSRASTDVTWEAISFFPGEIAAYLHHISTVGMEGELAKYNVLTEHGDGGQARPRADFRARNFFLL